MAQHAEKTKPLSWVWSYFKPTEIGGVRYNVCHAPIVPGSNELCLKRMIPDKSGGTKSMGNHLERKHRLSKSDPPPLTPITRSLGPSNQASSSSSKRRLNRDSLIQGILRLVVACNLPVQIANNQHFVDLLHLCNPLITRSLLGSEPHLTLARSIHQKFKFAKQALQSHLDQLTTTCFSLTATVSTPPNRNHSVLALVLHWVSEPPCSKSVLLAITQLSREPSPNNIALAIAQTLKEYNLQNRIFSLTIDNVPDLNQFGNDLVALVPQFKPESQLIGCMARLINHAAEIALDAFQHSGHLPDDPTQNSDVRTPDHFNLRTVISRLQDLTLLLRQSTQKTESFNLIVAAVTNNETHQPMGGFTTSQSSSSWTSTYQFLSHAHQIKEAIQIFCLKESGFAQYHIHDEEWNQVRLVSDFLKPLNVAANAIATDKACDMITATPTYCWLLRRLNKVQRNYEGREIPKPIKRMLEILNEFSEKTSKSPVHIFGMILDPRIKMSNFEDQSPLSTHSQSNENMNSRFMDLQDLRKAFYVCSLRYSQHPVNKNNHKELHPTIINNPEQQQPTINPSQNNLPGSKRARPTHEQQSTSYLSDSDSDSDYKTGQPRIFKKKPKLMIGLEDEISNYLEMECEESNCNPLEYWKLNSNKFPSLSQMAKDFLAIQSSTGLAFKATCKFNQLFESSCSSDSSIHDENNLEHHRPIDSHFINPTTAPTHLNPHQQRSHHTLMHPDHLIPGNNAGQSNSSSSSNSNTSNQRLIAHPFPLLHPSPQTQTPQEMTRHHHNVFPMGGSDSGARREQDILVDARAHLQEVDLKAAIEGGRTDSSSNQHLILVNRHDYLPAITNTNATPTAPPNHVTHLSIPTNSDSNNIGLDIHDGLVVHKLDAFASRNPLFSHLCHLVCLYDWSFLHDFIQI